MIRRLIIYSNELKKYDNTRCIIIPENEIIKDIIYRESWMYKSEYITFYNNKIFLKNKIYNFKNKFEIKESDIKDIINNNNNSIKYNFKDEEDEKPRIYNFSDIDLYPIVGSEYNIFKVKDEIEMGEKEYNMKRKNIFYYYSFDFRLYIHSMESRVDNTVKSNKKYMDLNNKIKIYLENNI